jgi:hypothetical protein
MCEPDVRARTGLSVEEHQRRTIASVLELRALAPEIAWAPLLQSWTDGDYWRHAEQYERAGVDLRREARVGLGSVCRRQSTVRAGSSRRRSRPKAFGCTDSASSAAGFATARGTWRAPIRSRGRCTRG